MRRSYLRPALAALVLLTLGAFGTAQAQTIQVAVDGEFNGTIATAGVDTVNVAFYATQGSPIQIKVQADRGTTLQPTIAVQDGAAQPVAGSTQRIRWLPAGNFLHYFTAPADGNYVAVIGASSGNGGFWGKITGNATAPAMPVTLSGTVTDAGTGGPIAGATVTVDGAAFATTSASGFYSGNLPSGTYDVSFAAAGYETVTQSVTLDTADVTLNVALAEFVAVVLSTSYTGDSAVGGSGTASVDIQAAAGVTVTGIQWTQVFGTPVTLGNATTADATVGLGDLAEYKDELILVLSEPPIGEDQLPPNVPLPEGEFPGGLQDRTQVVGISPFALEETGLVRLEVEVTTSAGVFTDELEIHSSLPWSISPGLRNVPIGKPVVVRSRETGSGSYTWSFARTPVGSTATLNDANTRTPYFTPDLTGEYRLLVEDGVGGEEFLRVYAGTWRGIIVDQDVDGFPVVDSACTVCHNPTDEGDAFVPWTQTGHALAHSDNINASRFYGTRCFSCHTVGYDPGVDNGGQDEAADYQDFLDAGIMGNPSPDNWRSVLDQFPETARLGNIQCENCHGPQDSLGHGFGGPPDSPRVSLSADVCGVCHGEPLRHGRFQQWQLSGHANYEVAIDESQSGSCSRCHTANGFLAWLPVLLGDEPGDPLDSVAVTWTEDEAHPQTCVTCHDPHNVGTSSGNDPDVNIYISGDTPPLIAGFTATDLGKGAICATCHNSRRGLRNDDTFDALSASEKARAPHGSAQSDVLMGQNAMFVEVGTRGGHSTTGDSCVDCHMKQTPPPDILSYNFGGANHTFYAEDEVCAACHSPSLVIGDVQNSIQFLLDQVGELIGEAYIDLFAEQIAAGNTIDLNGDATITDAADVESVGFGETRGRQAIEVTFVGGGTFGLYRLTDVDVLDGTGAVVGTLADFADDRLLKAGWNWNLFNNDGSVGVHNPTFASEALAAARDGVAAVSPGAFELNRSYQTEPRDIPRVIERSPVRPTSRRQRGR